MAQSYQMANTKKCKINTRNFAKNIKKNIKKKD